MLVVGGDAIIHRFDEDTSLVLSYSFMRGRSDTVVERFEVFRLERTFGEVEEETEGDNEVGGVNAGDVDNDSEVCGVNDGNTKDETLK